MRYFYYQRLMDTGQVQTAVENLAFNNPTSARYYLEQRWEGATIVKIWMLPSFLSWFYQLFQKFFQPQVQREEVADLFRNVAIMLRSGIPMFTAIEDMASEDSTVPVRRLSKDLLESLRSGASFSESVERHADVIPETVIHLVRIGESSGTLDRTLMDAAEHLKRVGKIMRDSKRAMIYPAFVFVTIIAAAVFWITYVIPSISGLFKQMQVELPAITLAVLAFSEDFTNNMLTIFLTTAIVIFALVYGVKKNPWMRYQAHRLALIMPVSKILAHSSTLAFITEYMSLLISSGLSMVDSLEILEKSTRNEVYRRTITQMKQGVIRGNTLSSEMKAVKLYPRFVVRMISVGEDTGRLDEQLEYLASEYRERFNHVVASISEIIKPVVMLFAGGLFLLLIVALFLPIYQLIGNVT
ncbi:MAG: type II secretion system F family protein [Hydrogenovibrio sp.]|uniref:type II secretion system F family protein n=1 Tax=Hydrogenovibrio sp. TaxID=2065821 RepID=UPI0028703E30|nr:type II secretion system F family protein [Hydrogenovibrio sp.]MDR9497818.1 type II secretion system F family protein [Hydrogenovibrio sp.]